MSESRKNNIVKTSDSRRFFIYARKSTEDVKRQVRSIPDQLAELRELARKENITVIVEFQESQTAKVPGRPIFNEMLDRIERGEADGILAWHPDRLSRNGVDGGRVMDMLDTGSLVNLKFCTYWFDSTPQGKFMLAIAFGQSKYYVDKLSEDIRRGKRQKVQSGIWPQLAPLGYLNDNNTKTIVVDPVRGPLVRQVFELYVRGDVTLDRLTVAMNELGLRARYGRSVDGTPAEPKPLTRTQYHRLLQNPIYYGLISYAGEHYEGRHEPLITKALFEKVQVVMRQRGKKHERVLKPYVFRKIFRCGNCGCTITIETQKGHNYLRCTRKKDPCYQPFVREEDVAAQVSAALGRVTLPTLLVDEMMSDLGTDHAAQDAARASHLAALQVKMTHVDNKLTRLTDAYVEEAMSLEEFRPAKAKLVDQKLTLQTELKAMEGKDENRLEPLMRFVKALQEATLLASSHNVAEKIQFLKRTGSNLTIQDRKVRCDFSGPWKYVENHGRFAQAPTAAPLEGAAARGETNIIFTPAERGRFELP